MQEGPDSPITRFTSINVVPANTNLNEGNFFGFPQLTQAQIDSIPEENLLPGIVVYNTDYNVYMAWFINEEFPDENRWNNINTSLTYKGGGYEVGSPFALPAGPASIVEANVANQDPGVMYVNTENGDQPRIYIPGSGWVDVAVGGGSDSPTFENVDVTNTLAAYNISSTNLNTFDITATGDANLNFLNVAANASFESNTMIQNLQIGSVSTVGGLCGTVTSNIIATPGSALGSGGSIVINGSPMSGVLTFHIGSGQSGTVICTLTLPNVAWQLYSASFAVIITPLTTADLINSDFSGVTASVTSLSTGLSPAVITITSKVTSPLTGATSFNYMIIGNTASDIG